MSLFVISPMITGRQIFLAQQGLKEALTDTAERRGRQLLWKPTAKEESEAVHTALLT